eukprot:XP_001944868.2 PREDICTED: sodium channel protein 60E-like [Acyrthosiphon pisum]
MLPIRLPNTILASRRQQPPTPSPTEPKVQVRPLTKDSLETRQHVSTSVGYGYQTRNKVSVLDGSVLPSKFEPFPSELYGMPLEEIDNFIFDETFCVVSKRFRKNYIHRFTATQSFFMFSPWNSFRQLCIYISTNQIFDYVVMTTILLNCVFLAKTDSVEEAEYIFLAIYTAEMVIKTISKGFILNKYTYLRNPWNWLDFIVITSGYATIGMDVGNLAGLRTFRVLRALKTVSIMPGLKTIINALLHSFRQLAEVMTLTIFCLMVFALFALQVYMGELRNKCVMINEDNVNWLKWINKEQNWLSDNEGNPMLCGNVTGARHCPVGYVCLGVGPNPNHGYTNFDNFLWSMLTTFQLITLDYWENVYNIIIFFCKAFADRLKIQTSNPESYRALIQFLKEQGAEYHTYQLKQDKPIRVVIRNLHPTTEVDTIKEELEEYGHTKTYCGYPSRCVRCGSNHKSPDCPNQRSDPPKCALCAGDHPASYKGCSIYKNLQRAKKPFTKSNFLSTNTNTRVNTTTVRDSHPINDTHPIQSDNRTPTYSQAISGRTANDVPPPTTSDLNTTITNFLEDFKSLINPLISLLTKVIEKLLAK